MPTEITMRALVTAAVVLSACSPGPVGPQGPSGPQGAPGAAADVAGLVARLDAAEREIAALRGAGRVKVPHLIVKETGEDLGVMLDWQTAWSEKLAAPLNLDPVAVFYSGPNCTGEAVVARGAWEDRSPFLTGPDGAVVRATDRIPGAWASASQRTAWTGCIDDSANQPGQAVLFVADGMTVSVTRASQRAVEMR